MEGQREQEKCSKVNILLKFLFFGSKSCIRSSDMHILNQTKCVRVNF